MSHPSDWEVSHEANDFLTLRKEFENDTVVMLVFDVRPLTDMNGATPQAYVEKLAAGQQTLCDDRAVHTFEVGGLPAANVCLDLALIAPVGSRNVPVVHTVSEITIVSGKESFAYIQRVGDLEPSPFLQREISQIVATFAFE